VFWQQLHWERTALGMVAKYRGRFESGTSLDVEIALGCLNLCLCDVDCMVVDRACQLEIQEGLDPAG